MQNICPSEESTHAAANKPDMENKLSLQCDFNQLKLNYSNSESQQLKGRQQNRTPKDNSNNDSTRLKHANSTSASNKQKSFNKHIACARERPGGNNENDLIFNNDLLVENGGRGSRKQNLNHLLNFQYSQIKENQYDYETKMMKQFWSTKLNKTSIFTKEQFLQANIHYANPDILVEWDKIEEIQINTHDSISCPICLYEPVATKMTKCGHIYCWCCILHYLALSDKAWRKCPICFESIYKNDLKSCTIIKHREYKLNDVVKLNLMFREMGSTVVLPVRMLNWYSSNKLDETGVDYNKIDDDCAKDFMKLQAVSNDFILTKIVERESNELNRQLRENENEPEVCFINSALSLLDQRKAQLAGVKDEESVIAMSNTLKPCQETVVAQATTAVKYNDAFLESVEDCTRPVHGTQEAVVNQGDQQQQKTQQECVQKDVGQRNKAKQSINQNEEFFYMYQSCDGQRIFMSSLNLRCLLHEYGSIGNCPTSVSARIVAIDSLFMDDDLRRRYKYLSHLPLHSDFRIVELDLVEPIVSIDTLNQFSKEIETRRLARSKKEMDEIKRLKRYESSISTKAQPYYRNYSDFNETNKTRAEAIPNNYNEAFPVIDDLDESNESASIKQSSASNQSSSPPVGATNSPQQFSFAQMLKQDTITASNNTMWPKLAGSANANPVVATWGKSQLVMTPNKPFVDHIGNGDIDDDSDVQVPGYQESFLLAIDSALESAKKNANKLPDDSKQANKSNGKKNKKTKNLLFSTSLNLRN